MPKARSESVSFLCGCDTGFRAGFFVSMLNHLLAWHCSRGNNGSMEQSQIDIAAALDTHTATMKAEEVEYLTKSAGWPHAMACELVGVDAGEVGNSEKLISYLPMHHEIQAMTTAMRAGTLIISRTSGNRWKQWRDDEPDIEVDTEEAEEDVCPAVMPSWFRGASC